MRRGLWRWLHLLYWRNKPPAPQAIHVTDLVPPLTESTWGPVHQISALSVNGQPWGVFGIGGDLPELPDDTALDEIAWQRKLDAMLADIAQHHRRHGAAP